LLKTARDEDAKLVEAMSRSTAILDSTTHLAKRQISANLRLLGIDIEKYDPDLLQKNLHVSLSSAQRKTIADLIAARAAARARKDFNESDRIRDELAAMGVVIKDSKEGTTWEIAR
jgi:cysteinyl-tRNA synthetase